MSPYISVGKVKKASNQKNAEEKRKKFFVSSLCKKLFKKKRKLPEKLIKSTFFNWVSIFTALL